MEINNFSQYLEDLCSRHVDLQHGLKGVHFVDLNDKKNTSIDSELCYPAVVMEKASYKYSGEEIAYTKDRDYLIFVMDHVDDTGDYDQIDSVTDKCEQILDELFNQILEDKRQRKYKFILGFSLPGTEAEPVYNKDNSLYGVSATFTMTSGYTAKNCRQAFN